MSGRVFLPAYVANLSDGGIQLDLPSAGYKHPRALQQLEWANLERASEHSSRRLASTAAPGCRARGDRSGAGRALMWRIEAINCLQTPMLRVAWVSFDASAQQLL
jgi:hypothetical protein